MSVWLNIDRTQLRGAHHKLVKAAQFTEWQNAGSLLQAATRKQQTMQDEMEQQAHDLFEQAVHQGREQGRADYAAQLADVVARAESSFIGLEARIVNTVMRALTQILGELDQSLVLQRVLQRVLREARSNKSLRLRVSTEDYAEVNRQLALMLVDYPDIEFIDVIKDAQAASGTCILETEIGAVDASIDNQLAAVRRGLLAAFVGQRAQAPRSTPADETLEVK